MSINVPEKYTKAYHKCTTVKNVKSLKKTENSIIKSIRKRAQIKKIFKYLYHMQQFM